MKCFIEWLWSPVGIIRAGAICDEYGQPFDYAVVAQVPWRSVVRWLLGLRAPVILKALVADGGLSKEHSRVAFRALKEQGFTASWERYKPGQKRRLVISHG